MDTASVLQAMPGLTRMALPLAATFFMLCQLEPYTHRLMMLGLGPVLKDLLHVPVVPVQVGGCAFPVFCSVAMLNHKGFCSFFLLCL